MIASRVIPAVEEERAEMEGVEEEGRTAEAAGSSVSTRGHFGQARPRSTEQNRRWWHPCVGKSGFVSHTKHTVEATNMDLFHSWLITCDM